MTKREDGPLTADEGSGRQRHSHGVQLDPPRLWLSRFHAVMVTSIAIGALLIDEWHVVQRLVFSPIAAVWWRRALRGVYVADGVVSVVRFWRTDRLRLEDVASAYARKNHVVVATADGRHLEAASGVGTYTGERHAVRYAAQIARVAADARTVAP